MAEQPAQGQPTLESQKIMVTPLPHLLDEMGANAASARQAAVDAQYAADEANKAAANVKAALDAAKEELRDEVRAAIAYAAIELRDEFNSALGTLTDKLDTLSAKVGKMIVSSRDKAAKKAETDSTHAQNMNDLVKG